MVFISALFLCTRGSAAQARGARGSGIAARYLARALRLVFRTLRPQSGLLFWLCAAAALAAAVWATRRGAAALTQAALALHESRGIGPPACAAACACKPPPPVV
jgi:hypothetical protein